MLRTGSLEDQNQPPGNPAAGHQKMATLFLKHIFGSALNVDVHNPSCVKREIRELKRASYINIRKGIDLAELLAFYEAN